MSKKTKTIIFFTFIILIILFFSLRIIYLNSIKGSTPNFITINSYQSETKYDNIKVYTLEESQNDKRSLLHIAYPVTENKMINLKLEEIAQDFLSEYKGIAKDQELAYQDYIQKTGQVAMTFRTEYIQHFDISFANDKYLLFIFDQYRNTGNTGNDKITSVLFNRETGENLPLASLFNSDDYLEVLSKKSRLILNKRNTEIAESIYFENDEEKTEWLDVQTKMLNAGTEATSDNFNSLSISDNKELIIIFDKYQVGPGSDGIVEIKIPLNELYQILSDEVKNIFDVVNDSKQENISVEKDNELNKLNAIDCSKESCVALTFDDGPSVYTDRLLDILKENNVTASFFILGRSAKIQPDTIRRIVREGHVIGNHTWDHKDLTKISIEAIQKQISDTDELIKKITNYDISFLRPPYGFYDDKLLKDINKTVILWNIDPEDWKDRDTELIIERMSQAEAGSIILAHDIYRTTIEAIPQLIKNLKQKGLQFVTVDKLFTPESLKGGQVLRHQ